MILILIVVISHRMSITMEIIMGIMIMIGAKVPVGKIAKNKESVNESLAPAGVSPMLPNPVGAGFHQLLSGMRRVSGAASGDLRRGGQIG